MSRPIDRGGMVLIDKPAGMTSHDVVRSLRRTLGVRRIGHAGTLDPLARGLLPCLVGPMTRLSRFLHEWSKSYIGLIHLGEETATGDAEARGAGPSKAIEQLPPRAVIDRAVERLSGTYLQVPPAYSAKKIGGVPAHRLARQGFTPALESAQVTVHRLRVVPAGTDTLAFAARVSSGTYLRSLARDMGRLLGTGGYLELLRRTRIGPLSIREASPPRSERPPNLLPPEAIPLPFPTIELDTDLSANFRHGRLVAHPSLPARGRVRVVCAEGLLLGIGDVDRQGRLQPEVVLG